MRGLEALGVTQDSYGCLLLPVMMKKIPEDVRRIIIRNCNQDGGIITLKLMREYLHQEIEARERSQCGLLGLESGDASTNPKTTPKATSTCTYFSGMSSKYGEDKKNCIFCSAAHPAETCNMATSNEHRVSILRKHGRCFNCFKRNHMLKNCSSKKRCKNCGGKHHVAICRTKDKDGRDHNATDDTADITKKSLEKVSSCSVVTRDTILLQSA